MASARRLCTNKPDIFCYVCGEYTLLPQRNSVTSFIKQAYDAYFGMKLGDQDKTWAPHMVCKSCTEHLRQWTKGKKKCLNFGIPMVWREPRNHDCDYYVCANDITGIYRKKYSMLRYSVLEPARHPVPHSDEIPVPVFSELPDISEDESSSMEESENDVMFDSDNAAPQPLSQKELNHLVRDLSLTKTCSELLAFRFKEKKLLTYSSRLKKLTHLG